MDTTMETQERTLLSKVEDWLREKNPKVGELSLDLDLIENRVIDSLSFVDFLFFLEDITGRDLEAQSQSVHPFRTLRSIRDTILLESA